MGIHIRVATYVKSLCHWLPQWVWVNTSEPLSINPGKIIKSIITISEKLLNCSYISNNLSRMFYSLNVEATVTMVVTVTV